MVLATVSEEQDATDSGLPFPGLSRLCRQEVLFASLSKPPQQRSSHLIGLCTEGELAPGGSEHGWVSLCQAG